MLKVLVIKISCWTSNVLNDLACLPLTTVSVGTVDVDAVRPDAQNGSFTSKQLLPESTQVRDLLQKPILGGATLHSLQKATYLFIFIIFKKPITRTDNLSNMKKLDDVFQIM